MHRTLCTARACISKGVNLKLAISSFHSMSYFCELRSHLDAKNSTQRFSCTQHPIAIYRYRYRYIGIGRTLLSRQVKDYRWDASCLGRYHIRHEIHEKGRNLRQKYVTFDKAVLFRQPMNQNLSIDLSKIYQACLHNISFKELILMTSNKPY